jgi:hypothetical protein
MDHVKHLRCKHGLAHCVRHVFGLKRRGQLRKAVACHVEEPLRERLLGSRLHTAVADAILLRLVLQRIAGLRPASGTPRPS